MLGRLWLAGRPGRRLRCPGLDHRLLDVFRHLVFQPEERRKQTESDLRVVKTVVGIIQTEICSRKGSMVYRLFPHVFHLFTNHKSALSEPNGSAVLAGRDEGIGEVPELVGLVQAIPNRPRYGKRAPKTGDSLLVLTEAPIHETKVSQFKRLAAAIPQLLKDAQALLMTRFRGLIVTHPPEA